MRALAFALLLLTTPLLGGCLEARSEARLGPKGEGTFSETITVDLARLALARAQVEEMAEGMGADPAALNPFARFDSKIWLARLEATDGIEDVVSASATAAKGTRKHVIRGRFTNLQALVETGPVDDIEGALWKQDDGKAWHFETRSLYDDDRWGVASRKRLVELRRRLLEPFRETMAGFEIRRTIVFPSAVLETNGLRAADQRTVTWTLRFDDLADPTNLRQRVVFASTPQLKLVGFGSKPAAAAAPGTAGKSAKK